MNIKHNFFKNTFFPSTIIELAKLDSAIRNSTSCNSFKESILKFIIPAQNSILQCQNHKAIKYIKRLRVDFSLIHDHKFKYSFQDTINWRCTFSLEAETTNDFVLHCPYYEKECHILITSIGSIKSSILDQNDNKLVKILFCSLDNLIET